MSRLAEWHDEEADKRVAASEGVAASVLRKKYLEQAAMHREFAAAVREAESALAAASVVEREPICRNALARLRGTE